MHRKGQRRSPAQDSFCVEQAPAVCSFLRGFLVASPCSPAAVPTSGNRALWSRCQVPVLRTVRTSLYRCGWAKPGSAPSSLSHSLFLSLSFFSLFLLSLSPSLVTHRASFCTHTHQQQYFLCPLLWLSSVNSQLCCYRQPILAVRRLAKAVSRPLCRRRRLTGWIDRPSSALCSRLNRPPSAHTRYILSTHLHSRIPSRPPPPEPCVDNPEAAQRLDASPP